MIERDADREFEDLLDEIHRIEVLSKRLVTDVLTGAYASAFKGSGVEFDEVREYEPGDDPRSIDWSVTARAGKPFIKKYVDERELTVLFVFDVSRSMDCGFGGWSSRQMAARVLACLALTASASGGGGDKVGLVTCDKDVRSFVRPAKGRNHVLRILRDCLAGGIGIDPAGTDLDSRKGQAAERHTDLTQALDFVASAQRRKAVVFVISDFAQAAAQAPHDADLAQLQQACTACASRHDVIAVRVTPPELRDIDRLKPLRLHVEDPEGSKARSHAHTIDFANAEARTRIAASVRDHRNALDHVFRSTGVDCIDVDTPWEQDLQAVVRPLLGFFQRRTRRGGGI